MINDFNKNFFRNFLSKKAVGNCDIYIIIAQYTTF